MMLALIFSIFLIASIGLVLRNFLGRNGIVLLFVVFNISAIIWIISQQAFFGKQLLCLIQIAPFTLFPTAVNFTWGFLIDPISCFFLVTILVITTCILFFAVSYMYTEARFPVFFSYLQFFMFFMLILVLSSNIVQLFIGWEGVGIVSFLLVNFWYMRQESNQGALKALLFNRIGDVGYLGFVVVTLVNASTANLLVFPFFETYSWILFFVLLAAFGKSAQLFLYAWLPDAMEGPTPVSALLHSATMVTAGVYLIVRCFDFVFCNSFVYILIISGGLTSIMCGLFAFTKFDIKKIIAFSTCSQLGLMVCSLGFGYIAGAFFHLFIHAFFKALLFVASGIIIHALVDEQDTRKYGISYVYAPVFFLVILIGSLNIVGFFFFSGFYSKEFIISYTFISHQSLKILLFISSGITILYSVRLYFLVFRPVYTSARYAYLNSTGLDSFLLFSIFVLSMLSLFGGFLFFDSFVGLGYTQNFMASVNTTTLSSEQISITVVSFFVLFVFVCVLFMNSFCLFLTRNFNTRSIIYLFNKELYVPTIYWVMSYSSVHILFKYLTEIFDRGLLDRLSFFGLTKNAFKVSFIEKRVVATTQVYLFSISLLLIASCLLLAIIPGSLHSSVLLLVVFLLLLELFL